MRILTAIFLHIANFIRRAIAGYEPVAVRGFVTSVFAALALGGYGTGELPAWVEMALALAAILIPTALAFNARAKVTPTKQIDDPGKLDGDDDLHPLEEPDDEDPDADLADVPGEHKAGRDEGGYLYIRDLPESIRDLRLRGNEA